MPGCFGFFREILMHRLLRPVPLVLLLVAAAPGYGADRDAALAVIDQAIKAQGGADVLTRAQTIVRSATGVLMTFGKETPFTEELSAQLPDRFRLVLDLRMGQQKARLIQLVNGDHGWESTGGPVAPLSKERLEELRQEAFVRLWLATLVPLKDSSLELGVLPDAKLNDQPAAVVKVGRKGQPDLKFYFDKANSLLVKIDRRASEAGLVFDQEFSFSDYKDFDGAKLATKQVEMRGGKKFAELAGISYKFPRTFDESVFTRP
jgi:hypothetical protein